ncbi:hypothetical protein PN498_15110 [Oscillatoria sp. CS-180]|uniref:hypothetical protein n=1 Tax=Oscillatoria sp. CS-180 TaxID=3021720 RepID=UPI00232CB2F2|nr:hypothetical protein [Oscillatoria sp. CS-180]MDB9527328.1 hypothetical protein [Oscillatoria sp. CS-180]
MTTTVKERIQTEMDQAQDSGKQRAERISDILKAAASLTFEELKGGSAELQVSARRSLSELLEDLQEASDTEDAQISEILADAESEEPTVDSEPAPTWRELFGRALAVVRDRKGDWLQQFREQLRKDAVKFDNDMTGEHGDRYLKVKSILKRVIARFEELKANRDHDVSSQTAQPVNVEIADGDIVEVSVSSGQDLRGSEQVD